MSEVKVHQSVQPKVSAASLAGAGKKVAKENTADALDQLANQSKKVVEQSTAAAAEMKQAVARMNEFVQTERRELNFSIDDITGSTVVKVTDSNSGELIRQIPSELFLRLAQEAKQREELHLINVRG